MDDYDIVIIGAGPAGIAIALMLEKTGKKILVVEREKKMGGCWRVEWQDGQYFTEHSPKISTDKNVKFRALCSHLKVKNTYANTYSQANSLNTTYKATLASLTYTDILKLFSGMIISRFIENKQTVDEFSEHLSDQGKKALYVLSVALASTPDRVMMQDIYNEGFKLPPNIIQLKEPELWINAAHKHFMNSKNITLKLGLEVNNISKNERGTFIINNTFEADKIILALPPNGLRQLISGCTDDIKSNWMPYDKFKQWSIQSEYHSIGFQLHFIEDIEYKSEWCWSCNGEWNIIILPMSKYLIEYSRDEDIKTVWSCTLIDQTNFSSRLKKTISECSLQEIEDEVLWQLKLSAVPKKITFYDGLKHINGKYQSKDSGFIRNKHGVMPHTGKISNIHIVSTVNQSGVITIESALESSCKFVKEHYPGCEKILCDSSTNVYKQILLITIIVVATWLFLTKNA